MGNRQTDNEQLTFWWQQCLADDTAALEKIHTALFDGLYNYALKLLHDEALANDALQDLFIRIWNKRGTIGTIQKVKLYFFSALRRQILNQLRDLKLKSLKIGLLHQPDIEFSQEEILIQKQEDAFLKEKLTQILNTLPERQREIIYLHYFENMSLPHIAELMNINYQSVQNLKQRALANLRQSDLLSHFLLLYASYWLTTL